MRKYYKDFYNQYPVSKTLRFELIPQNETLENMQKNGVLEDGEKRSEDYKKLKVLMDEYYRQYIDEVLSDVHLEGLDGYARLYKIENRSEPEKAEFEQIQQELRDQVVDFLKSGERYNILFKKELIEKELPEFLIRREEDLEIVKSFKGFTTMCQGFWKNRENMFSAEAKSTAIANRAINENLPKFMNNQKIFRTYYGDVTVSDELLQKLGVNQISEVFELDYFDKIMSQNGIDLYNSALGGFTLDGHIKIQGLNELGNLENQKKTGRRIPSLQPLYKQILSDVESMSFKIEEFHSDSEVLEAIAGLCESFQEDVIESNGVVNTCLTKLDAYNTDGIFIRNGKVCADFSKLVFDDWNYITSCLNAWYDSNFERKQKSEEKYVEARKKYFKQYDSFSLDFIKDALTDDEPLEAKYQEKITHLVGSVQTRYDEALAILSNTSNDENSLISNKENDAIEKLKALLDSMKELEAAIRLLDGTGEEPTRDELFYSTYSKCENVCMLLDHVYDKTRNYVTKKPYKTEKIKIDFAMPTLLSGWDRNKETANKSVLLRKDGYYYLGIMNKKDNKIFEAFPSGEGDCYEKMNYKLLPGPNKMLPKVFFAKSNIDYYAPDAELLKRYKAGTHKKGKMFNLQDCHNLIDFFKKSIEKHPDWKDFGFQFSDTNTYADISGFYKEVSDQGYKVRFEPISTDYVDELVRSGKLYLFKIYNKDFSPYSKGKPNLHTLYWKALFSEENLKKPVYKLNGEAEIFYRKKSISDNQKVIHAANEPIRRRRDETQTSLFTYDIVKDRRYTVDKFQFHVPITMNFTADGSEYINADMRKAISECDDLHIIGIDRGERHLLYVSVIDLNGNIKEQFSLNQILDEYKSGNTMKSIQTNYKELLQAKEEERLDARKQWKTIENIKELKAGYLSQVVHVIVNLMIKYNAIVVMEDLNFGFKRGRQKVERQVYQKFEKALIDKLNYLVDKSAEPNSLSGIFRALQLTEKFTSFAKMGKQNGALFYVDAWNTSKMDPTTGFVNLLYPKYENMEKAKAFLSKLKEIRWVNDERYGKYLAMTFDYNDFTEKADGSRTLWTICSYGTRLYGQRTKQGRWENQEVDLTKEYVALFERYDIVCEHDLREQIMSQSSAEFFKKFMWLLKLTLQIRNSVANEATDYMLSPVKNSKGEFFDTRNVEDNTLPTNADANGAYNIARKGLYIVEQLKKTPDDKLAKVSLRVERKEWLKFAQR